MENDNFFEEYFKGQILETLKNDFFFMLEDNDNLFHYISWEDENGNEVDENYKGKVIKVKRTIPQQYFAKTEQDFEKILFREFEKAKADNIELFRDELLNFVDAMIKDHDNNFTAQERLDFFSSKQTYMDFKNWLASYEVKKDDTTKGIIRTEFEKIKEKFTNEKAYKRAIEETVKFFENEKYRAITPIREVSKAKIDLIKTFKNIAINSGRNIAYKKDTDYLEFIKSLFFVFAENDLNYLGSRLEKEN